MRDTAVTLATRGHNVIYNSFLIVPSIVLGGVLVNSIVLSVGGHTPDVPCFSLISSSPLRIEPLYPSIVTSHSEGPWMFWALLFATIVLFGACFFSQWDHVNKHGTLARGPFRAAFLQIVAGFVAAACIIMDTNGVVTREVTVDKLNYGETAMSELLQKLQQGGNWNLTSHLSECTAEAVRSGTHTNTVMCLFWGVSFVLMSVLLPVVGLAIVWQRQREMAEPRREVPPAANDTSI